MYLDFLIHKSYSSDLKILVSMAMLDNRTNLGLLFWLTISKKKK